MADVCTVVAAETVSSNLSRDVDPNDMDGGGSDDGWLVGWVELWMRRRWWERAPVGGTRLASAGLVVVPTFGCLAWK